MDKNTAGSRAAEFWDTYFAGQFTSLTRKFAAEYRGARLREVEDGETMLYPEVEPSEIGWRDIAAHEYKTDERFSGILQPSFSAALAHLLSQEQFQEETPPNRHRIRLIIRLLTSPVAGSRPAWDAVSGSLFSEFISGRISAEDILARRKALGDNTGKEYDSFMRIVLNRLKEESLSVAQTAALFACGEPPQMSVAELTRLAAEALASIPIPVKKAVRIVEQLLPSEEDYQRFLECGLTSVVHTERDLLLRAFALCDSDPAVNTMAMKIIENHKNEDMFLVFEAIKMIGACNAKDAIRFLVDCLNQNQMARYWDAIENALQKICSGSELIPVSLFGIDFINMDPAELQAMEGKAEIELNLEYGYWKKKLSSLPDSRESWFAHDAQSVFWEKRLRCAAMKNAPWIPSEHLEKLREDEVLPVMLEAASPAPEAHPSA